MSDSTVCTSWLSDPRRYTYGNILIDASTATVEKLQQDRDKIRNSLKNSPLHLILQKCL